MSRIPSGAEFHAAAGKRADAMVKFVSVAGEAQPPTESEDAWLRIGIVCGVTAAVEEMAAQGLLGGAS